jgi:hypothetical protein
MMIFKKIKSFQAKVAAVAMFASGSLFFSATAVAQTPANDTAISADTMTVGDRMADGSIYAGISPFTKKPMYVTAEDAPLTMTFNDAVKYAGNLNAHGCRDWRLPTLAELNILYQNRDKGALQGTFNSSSSPNGYYMSCKPFYDGGAWSKRFSDGAVTDEYRSYGVAVRCVR